MKNFPNILLVAGSGRNVGKSSLVVSLLEKFKNISPFAVKITPHFHVLPEKENLLIRDENFVISIENNAQSHKDTSRFLRAGARKVFFVQTRDDHLQKSFDNLMDYIGNEKIPIVIESGGLRNFIEPGVFVYVESQMPNDKGVNIKSLADRIVSLATDSFKHLPEQINWEEGLWKLSKP